MIKLKLSYFFMILILICLLTGCLNTNSIYQISRGMSRAEVYKALGKPDRVEVCGDFEKWYYKPYWIGEKYQYREVIFDNQRVTSYINPGVYKSRKHDLACLPNYADLPGWMMTFDDQVAKNY